MFKFDYGKYKGVLISIALFLLLDASVLILNFYISFEIADDALGVNLAGRQRMLSQRMAKTLFIMQSTQQDDERYQSALKELAFSQALFDETLNAFYRGGSARGADNNQVVLQAVTTPESIAAIEQTLVMWQPYKSAIEDVISAPDSGKDPGEALTVAAMLASQYNLRVLKLMNDLTVDLEQVASSKATRLRIIQTVGISLALINFFIIMFHFVRQLRESDVVVEKARRETTEILETVNEGLFLIDRNFIIGNQYSAKLLDMLGNVEVAGKPLQDLLKGLVSEKNAKTAENFIDLLFNEKIKEKLIGDLNPLQALEVYVQEKEGAFTTRHLSFHFARAYSEGEISHVLVTVTDITEKVKLEKALLESQKQNDNQIEMLTSLLHANPAMLADFIANVRRFFDDVNNELKTNSKSVADLREKARKLFRKVHNFKGEASSLGLKFYEDAAHLMEDSLSMVIQSSDPTGNDFLSFAVQLENLLNYTAQVEKLVKKLGEYGQKVAEASKENVNHDAAPDWWSSLDELVVHLAERNKKSVSLISSGFTDVELKQEYSQQIKSICIQLLRNSIVHGIEAPRDRVMKNKAETAQINLHLSRLKDNTMKIVVEDDGRGIDYEALRAKAIATGKWSREEVYSWPDRRLLGLIFKDGFSTAGEITKDAGRGVGMSAVAECINRYGGKVAVSSKPGRYCRFSITMPILAA